MVVGVVKFNRPDAVPSGQKILVAVQDTSRVDADAVEVASTVLTVPEGFNAKIDELPFEIHLDTSPEGLTIRAHMPKHVGDDVRRGDMITTSATTIDDTNQPIVVTLHSVT